MCRHVLRLMLVAAVAALLCAPAAGAAPFECDKTRPVLLIHGYQNDGSADCETTWGKAKGALYRAGWQPGRLKTVGYYSGDRNCSFRLNGRYGRNASIRDLGRALALSIYRRYTRKDQTVDVVAHSMGGLIARTAITGVQQKWPGFPPRLFVEDVVTLGTPHTGVRPDAKLLRGCRVRQCLQMRPGSRFLRLLAKHQNPQTIGGTDWTLIGSAADKTVFARSATKTRFTDGAMRAGHYVGFTPQAGISHGGLRTVTGRGNFGTQWRNGDGRWQTNLGRSPILAAGFAITYSQSW